MTDRYWRVRWTHEVEVRAATEAEARVRALLLYAQDRLDPPLLEVWPEPGPDHT